MSQESFFRRFYEMESFVDRFTLKGEEGVDVIITLLNTNDLWEKNLLSFYGEIPIKRLLIGDGGCTDDSLKTLQKFPRVKVFNQEKYYSQGYCLRELIENVETEWFVYLHADVYLPEHWYDEMIKYQNTYDWYECKRHFMYQLYDTADTQFRFERAYSGSQMGKKSAFKSITGQIDDDYIRRMEDIFFQQKIEENGFKYGKVPSTYHIHQVMNRKGEKEPKFTAIEVKREDDKEWSLRIAEEVFRATVKYLSPAIKNNVRMAVQNMRYVMSHSPATHEDLVKWVKETNAAWVNKISWEYHKWHVLTRLSKLKRFLYGKGLRVLKSWNVEI